MITMYTAYTSEIDEIDDAVSEVLAQLDFSLLKTHSAGLINCYPEFVETGVVTALCENLPFDVIGMTSLTQAIPGYMEKYGLCLSVLTSDDAEFSCACTGSLAGEDYKEVIEAAFNDAADKLSGKPSYIISYFPFIQNLGAYTVLSTFDEICGGTPIFGSVYMGSDMGYDQSANILNGAVADDAIAMLLVCSDDLPEFSSISMPEQDIRSTKTLVTDSDGTLVRTVNDVPLKDYLASVGYDSIQRGTLMQVYYPGSDKPVVLSIFSFNDDGSAYCGGPIPVGSSITFGEATREGVLATAEQCAAHIIKSGRKNGALFHPCAGRYFTLLPQPEDEISVIEKAFSEGVPYMLAYSGGEICPVPDDHGVLRNRFHNYSLCTCLF